MPTSAAGEKQLEDAKALATAASKALSALTVNASRSLGDAKRDPSSSLAEQHTGSVVRAITDTNLSDVATDQYDVNHVHSTLLLEMPPSSLVVTADPPKFEKLVDVLEVLDNLLAERGIFGEYRDMCIRVKGLLEETRERFRDSQVNIDEMDHAGVHKGANTLREVVLTSAESVVEKLNEETAALVAKYHELEKRQLDLFEAEALSVEATSPARMRPTRPEDDEDAWQVPEDSREIVFESAALQRYVDGEKQRRVAEIYDAEWTQERRRDVGRLLPRAQRVVEEQDVALYDEAYNVLDQLATLSDTKVDKIMATISHSDGETTRLLADLRESIRLTREAGDAFQAKKRAQREASERDLQKLATYVSEEEQKDVRFRAAFAEKRASATQWLENNAAAIADRTAKVIALQEEILALSNDRKSVADDILEATREEEERRSRLAEMVRRCKEYENMLLVSMRNFLLPEGYSGILVDFTTECERLARERFEGHNATLSRLRAEALREANITRASAFIAPRLLTYRYRQRIDDLAAKAELARKMRDFCESTKDPYLGQHLTTESEIAQLSAKVNALVSPLQTASDSHRALYDERIREQLRTYNVPTAFEDIDDLFWAVLNQDEKYVARASRPALVTLALPPPASLDVPPGQPALLLPRVHYDLSLIDRAAKARTVNKQFA